MSTDKQKLAMLTEMKPLATLPQAGFHGSDQTMALAVNNIAIALDNATQELAFKAGSRDVSKWKNLPSDTVKTTEEWAFVYRMITGAKAYAALDKASKPALLGAEEAMNIAQRSGGLEIVLREAHARALKVIEGLPHAQHSTQFGTTHWEGCVLLSDIRRSLLPKVEG